MISIKQKVKARQELRLALINGVIKKPSKCQCCKNVSDTEGHHINYQEPLNVIWLCKNCHEEQHRKLKDSVVEKGSVSVRPENGKASYIFINERHLKFIKCQSQLFSISQTKILNTIINEYAESRIHNDIDNEQDRQVKEVASLLGVAEAEVIRRAITHYMKSICLNTTQITCDDKHIESQMNNLLKHSMRVIHDNIKGK